MCPFARDGPSDASGPLGAVEEHLPQARRGGDRRRAGAACHVVGQADLLAAPAPAASPSVPGVAGSSCVEQRAELHQLGPALAASPAAHNLERRRGSPSTKPRWPEVMPLRLVLGFV